MLLIIMRHGEAQPYQSNDRARELTRFGQSQSASAGKRLANFLLARGESCEIEQVLVSPYIRTQQTHEALNQHLAFTAKTDTEEITPVGSPQAVHDLIDGYVGGENGVKNLMLISHMPLVSYLADEVCLGFNGKIFDTADILIVDYDPDTHQGTQLALHQSMNEE